MTCNHDFIFRTVPKAELHVHLEGTMTPSMVRLLAKRHQMTLPDTLFTKDDRYNWKDFLDFLKVYDAASIVLKTPTDYYDITYDYLRQIADEGGIYAELLFSADHAAQSGGMSYKDTLDAMVQAIDDAREHFGIEGRLLSAFVRHYGVDQCIKVAKDTVKHAHPYVVGVNLAGDEAGFPPAQFKEAFEIITKAGLKSVVHAGEWCGPDEGIWEALNNLPVNRLGHGVRSIEDPKLVSYLVDHNIMLECCPTSNIAFGAFPSYEAHSFNKLRAAGVKVCLNTDDPPFVHTTLGQEYLVAHEHFGLNNEDLVQITKDAIEASFADEKTKKMLLKKVN